MEIRVVTIGRRAERKGSATDPLFTDYCARIGRFAPCSAENYLSEEKFLAALDRNRPRPLLVLLDSRGRSFSSEDFAGWLTRQRDQATPRLLFAVGPADGWSASILTQAGLLLSLGPMTLPHELAAVVLAEQVYRAFTIIGGHPYHLGHAD